MFSSSDFGCSLHVLTKKWQWRWGKSVTSDYIRYGRLWLKSRPESETVTLLHDRSSKQLASTCRQHLRVNNVCSQHTNWSELNRTLLLNTYYIPVGVFAPHELHDWAPTVLVSLQPIVSRDADARDQRTRRVTGSTRCRPVRFSSRAANEP